MLFILLSHYLLEMLFSFISMTGIPSSHDFLSYLCWLQTAIPWSRLPISTSRIYTSRMTHVVPSDAGSSASWFIETVSSAKLSQESHRCCFTTLFGVYFPHYKYWLQIQICPERGQQLPSWRSCIHTFLWHDSSVCFSPLWKRTGGFTQKSGPFCYQNDWQWK